MSDQFTFLAKNTNLRDAAETRGHVAYLMSQQLVYREYPMACLTAWIETPINIDQIKVFFDPTTSLPLGYVTWAWLAPDVEQRWLTDPDATLHFSEWNEGGRLWIMDFVAPFGHGYDMARYMQRHMFPDCVEAHSIRRDQDGKVRRHSVWTARRDHTSQDRLGAANT
ncbi:toxin-activating lysine-acyltransferase [Massilia sp. CT11-108]|uniref:toxin-activating lysine-acyltransferase n=1 Tax=Massilia sp. CT11-108 TaxID=3393900 RepID=UPI0039A6811D